MKKQLLEYCSKHVAKYAMPYDIEFRQDLPKTLVGKVAYRVLEQEELNKMAAAKAEEAIEQNELEAEAEAVAAVDTAEVTE